MRKAIFLRTCKPANSSGKVFEQGKSYWMAEESFRYWQGEDAVVEAAPDAVAENEPVQPLHPDKVVIRSAGRGRYHVHGPDNHRFSDRPLSADEAERLRQDVLDGRVKMPAPEKPADAPAPLSPPGGIEVEAGASTESGSGAETEANGETELS